MPRERRIRWWLVCLPLYPYLWGLWTAYDRLEPEAESADEPVAALSRGFGRGGPPGIARALVQSGSAPEEAESVAAVVARRLGNRWKGSFVVATAPSGFHHVTAYSGKKRAVVGRGTRGVKLHPVEERLVRAKGAVKAGLFPSLHAAGVPNELHQDFVDVFRWAADMAGDMQDEDTFTLLWTERNAAGRAVGRRLEAAAFDGEKVGRYAAIRWDGEFFDRDGYALRRAFLRSPLRYRAISSGFGGFRFTPLGWPMRRHRGTDFAAPVGTPVISVADGTISHVGALGEYGNLVKVRHTSGRETYYGHLVRYGSGVRPGLTIRQGQVLGYVGTTGNATGPHLHFELRRHGKHEDFREAELPGEPLGLALRPRRFRERWKQLLGR